MHNDVQIAGLVKIDIRGGKLTYGQRIEIGEILAREGASVSEKYTATMKCLHPDWVQAFTPEWIAWFEEVVDGLRYWMERETTMLAYQPTAEEIAAGINNLGKKLGPMMTVMTLAEKFGKDPDEILQWEYGKVFGLLYADLEGFKYQRNYRKVIESRERQRRLSRK
ncbi:MAG: hypothetical protein K2I32_06935 [Alistipes sp.]|nr:hypothetical protein [Alistipes sp.]